MEIYSNPAVVVHAQRQAREQRLDELALLINAEHAAVSRHVTETLQHALRAGEYLAAAKDKAGHGNWLTWLRENCPNISERTAQAYMRVWERRDELAAKSAGSADLSIDRALKSLAAPRKPSPPDEATPPTQDEAPPADAEERSGVGAEIDAESVEDEELPSADETEEIDETVIEAEEIADPPPEELQSIAGPAAELRAESWDAATAEQRYEFVAAVGIDELIGAILPTDQQLLRVVHGTDRDEEALAALRAVRRVLESRGLDFHSLLPQPATKRRRQT